jgi:transcription antitermination protein NusB
MTLPPQKLREAVFQMLFSSDFEAITDEMVEMMMQELKTTRANMREAKSRAEAVISRLSEIDPLIGSGSTEYSFERISRVERTILRLGVFELLFDAALPPLVAIAEAIRLCRKFATNESSQFVNAILDGVYKNREASNQPQPV